MADTAQLQEALIRFTNLVEMFSEWSSHIAPAKAEANGLNDVAVLASERLAQLEAGALIITPDEGKWPTKSIEAVVGVVERWDHRHRTQRGMAREVLDALRDAMPPEEEK